MVVVGLLASNAVAAPRSSFADQANPTKATDDRDPATSNSDPPQVTIALMPAHTTPAELAGVPGMAIGLMSAGIGNIPAEQTYLDIGQGARIPSSLYDEPLPPVRARASRAGGATIPARAWEVIRRRAAGAPADLEPGLLGSTLAAGGVRAGTDQRGPAVAILADERGRVPDGPCAAGPCPRVEVIGANLARLATLGRRLGPADLLIALEPPPPAPNHELAVGIAGGGTSGTLTSDSTRMKGYVLSTDLAPTVLTRLGLAVPSEISGEPIRGEGAVDPASLGRLADRLAAIGPRRGPVVGVSLLLWVGACALAGLAFGRRGLRAALPVLAVAVAYLPALLLLTAALQPSELAERLIAGLGSPALALLTLRLVPPFGALALAAAVSVVGYGVDVVAGSHLTELSLIGPNPAAGVRFYGIGNELEATVSALVPVATGAALVTWAPRASPRSAALAFAATAALGVAVFAPGRFGADVGIAIGLPLGAAVAAGTCLGAGRRRLALAVAAPVVALGALVAADLLTGGNAHLTRSVLRAGGFDQLSEVVQRRLQLSVDSFGRYAGTVMLWLAVAALLAGFLGRHRVKEWFREKRWAWAGLVGAVAATLAGTLVNDSGALLLFLGTAVAGATVAVAWATGGTSSCGRDSA
jgi:hypothetical protein